MAKKTMDPLSVEDTLLAKKLANSICDEVEATIRDIVGELPVGFSVYDPSSMISMASINQAMNVDGVPGSRINRTVYVDHYKVSYPEQIRKFIALAKKPYLE